MGLNDLFALPLREVETKEDIEKYHLNMSDEEFAKRLCEANGIRYIPENTDCLLILIRQIVNKCIEKDLITKDFKFN